MFLDESAKDAATTMTPAWRAYEPGSSRPLKTVLPRARLVLPTDGAEAGNLAAHYSHAALGNSTVKRSGAETVFVMDAMESRMASRKNNDGTVLFVLAEPPLAGFAFVRGERDGKRALIVRDGQHE